LHGGNAGVSRREQLSDRLAIVGRFGHGQHSVCRRRREFARAMALLTKLRGLTGDRTYGRMGRRAEPTG
jgi:hypothetical protein